MQFIYVNKYTYSIPVIIYYARCAILGPNILHSIWARPLTKTINTSSGEKKKDFFRIIYNGTRVSILTKEPLAYDEH